MDLASLRAQQIELASSAIREDRLDKDPPDLIAGADVGFEQGGEVTRAAMVLLKYPSLELVEYKVARIATTMPFIFSRSANIPALLAAWEICRKAGFGVCRWSWIRILAVLAWPAILLIGGCADHWRSEKRLCGKFEPLLQRTGRAGPLMDKGEQLAQVWRSKARCNPLFIATGHRVSVDSALAWVQRCMKGYRLPEPTRWADAVASERPAFVRYTANQPNSGKLRIISVFENSTCYKTQFICVWSARKLAARHFYGLLMRTYVPQLRRILSANRLRRWADLPPHSRSLWETLTVKDAKVNFDSQLENLKKRFLQPTISICTAFIRQSMLAWR